MVTYALLAVIWIESLIIVAFAVRRPKPRPRRRPAPPDLMASANQLAEEASIAMGDRPTRRLPVGMDGGNL